MLAFSAMNTFNSGELVNVGSGENISIKALANIVASVVNYTGDIELGYL
jgi:hypothetical protein